MKRPEIQNDPPLAALSSVTPTHIRPTGRNHSDDTDAN